MLCYFVLEVAKFMIIPKLGCVSRRLWGSSKVAGLWWGEVELRVWPGGYGEGRGVMLAG